MKRLFKSLAAMALVFGAMPSAQAGLIMEIDSLSGPTVLITDNGVGDINSLLGAITYFGSAGGIDINITTGLSKPLLPNDAHTARMLLHDVSITTVSGGRFQIRLSDDDFNLSLGGGPPPVTLGIASTISGSVSGTGSIAATDYVDLDNILMGTVGPNVTVLSHSLLTGIFSETLYAQVDYFGGNFSMTKVVDLVLSKGAKASFTFGHSSTIPEPATLVIFGLGLVGLGFMRRRPPTAC